MYPEEANMQMVEEVIRKISFSHFPMPITLRIYSGTSLHIKIETNDRETGLRCAVEGHRPVPPWFQRPSDFEMIVRWIHDEVLSLIDHEIQECILFDGRRVMDPHKPKNERPAFAPQEVVDALLKVARQSK